MSSSARLAALVLLASSPLAAFGKMQVLKRAPPGPAPALDFAILGSLNYSPAQVIDTDTKAIAAVQTAMFGPHTVYTKPAANASSKGKIQLSVGGFLGDGNLEGDPIWANVSDPGATVILPAATCGALPSTFSIWAILSEWSPYPYLGVSTFTGTAGADSTLDSQGGYGFLTPSNQTNAKTFATGGGSLGAPFGSESTIWSLACDTKQLTATWTQADGTQVPLSFVSWSVDGLIVTANYAALQAVFPSIGAPLTLTYSPTVATFYAASTPASISTSVTTTTTTTATVAPTTTTTTTVVPAVVPTTSVAPVVPVVTTTPAAVAAVKTTTASPVQSTTTAAAPVFVPGPFRHRVPNKAFKNGRFSS